MPDTRVSWFQNQAISLHQNHKPWSDIWKRNITVLTSKLSFCAAAILSGTHSGCAIFFSEIWGLWACFTTPGWLRVRDRRMLPRFVWFTKQVRDCWEQVLWPRKIKKRKISGISHKLSVCSGTHALLVQNDVARVQACLSVRVCRMLQQTCLYTCRIMTIREGKVLCYWSYKCRQNINKRCEPVFLPRICNSVHWDHAAWCVCVCVRVCVCVCVCACVLIFSFLCFLWAK